MIGYCLRDKKRVTIDNPRRIAMRDGSYKIDGSCSWCGTRVFETSVAEGRSTRASLSSRKHAAPAGAIYSNFRPARTEFKTAGDEARGIVDAIVNTTEGSPDRQKDIIHAGAFRQAITGKLPKVVNSHDATAFVGKVLSMRELMPGDPELPSSLRAAGLGGLWVRMQFNLETQAGRDMFSNVKGGFVDEWSFMFSIADSGYDSKGVRHIKTVDEIFEISPVLVGANARTLTLAAKSAGLRSSKSAARDAAVREAVRRVHYDLWLNGEVEVPREFPEDMPEPQRFPRSSMYPDGTRF